MNVNESKSTSSEKMSNVISADKTCAEKASSEIVKNVRNNNDFDSQFPL